MAQAFVTTYNNVYRWHDIDRRKSLRPVDKMAEQLPDGDIWIIPKKIGQDDEEGGDSLAVAQAAIHKMVRKRLWTVYQVDYCADMMPKHKVDEEEEGTESSGNALLAYGKSLYAPKKMKIPPPLPSARRLYGYIRPTNMYMPLSTFQNVHGRVAYDILDYNSRPKPQTAEVKPEDIAKKRKEEGDQDPKAIQNQLKENDASPKQNNNKRGHASNKKIGATAAKLEICKCSLNSR